MACIALIGGIPGCGKTELIEFITSNQNSVFVDFEKENSSGANKHPSTVEFPFINSPEIHIIAYDEMCTIEDQAKIRTKMKGWRDFRMTLLEASERYICSVCDIECQMQGPMSFRSHELFEKLKIRNDFTRSKNCSKSILILVEDNFYYRSMRYEWFQVARRENLGFCQILVTCPLELAIKRNNERHYSIPDVRIKLMHSSIQYPDPVKNHWEMFSLMFDNSTELQFSSIYPILGLIQSAMEKPAEIVINEDKIIAHEVCSKSVLHQADIILRKIVNTFIKDLRGNNASSHSAIKQVINARQKVFEDLKQNKLQLPNNIEEHVKNCGIDSKIEEELETILNETLRKWVNDLNIVN